MLWYYFQTFSLFWKKTHQFREHDKGHIWLLWIIVSNSRSTINGCKALIKGFFYWIEPYMALLRTKGYERFFSRTRKNLISKLLQLSRCHTKLPKHLHFRAVWAVFGKYNVYDRWNRNEEKRNRNLIGEKKTSKCMYILENVMESILFLISLQNVLESDLEIISII